MATPPLHNGPLTPREEPPSYLPQTTTSIPPPHLAPAFGSSQATYPQPPSQIPPFSQPPVSAQPAYSAPFENALMQKILHDTIPASSSLTSPSSPRDPRIVPLDSPLRSPSNTLHPLLPIPLTHPNGSPYGGPNSSPAPVPAMNQPYNPQRAQQIAAMIPNWKSIKGPSSLGKAVDKVVEEKVQVVKSRMERREEAVRRNEEIEREVGMLEEERKLERKVWENLRAER